MENNTLLEKDCDGRTDDESANNNKDANESAHDSDENVI